MLGYFFSFPFTSIVSNKIRQPVRTVSAPCGITCVFLDLFRRERGCTLWKTARGLSQEINYGALQRENDPPSIPSASFLYPW